ncbi:MAG TPA: ribosome maturation factor RimM [Candidatus Baltobacteraceae bacterium]|nr:ribosome maturation factor RimM [Candidatus Baltobacteraceae bacterium]
MQSSTNELPVGRIAGVFGIRGELKCDPTSAGRTLFLPGAQLRLALSNGTSENVELAGAREHKGRLLIRLNGVESANDAQRYVGATFYADRDRIQLEAGEYLDADLIGCTLHDLRGNALGTVTAVEHYPTSDMLVVAGKLVPLIKEFITSIDLEAKSIVADLPPGLLDEHSEEA